MSTLFYRDRATGKFYPLVGGGNDHSNLFKNGTADDHPQYVYRAYTTEAQVMTGPLYILDAVGTTEPITKGVVDAHDHKTSPSAYGYRRITASTASPTGGADGDVWFKYTATP